MKKHIRSIILVGIIILIMVSIPILFSIKKSANQATPDTLHNNSVSQSASPTAIPKGYSSSVPPSVTAATDDHARDLEIKYQNKTEPDLFLSNNLPYQTNDFAVSAAFTTTPTNHFYFIVSVKNSNAAIAKQKFIMWVQSLGLSQQQINQLDIRYQTE